MKEQEKGWKALAEGYLEEYGAALCRELEASKQWDALPTPGLDARVREEVAAVRRRKRSRLRLGGTLAAACLALALLTPFAWRLFRPQETVSSHYELLPLSVSLPSRFSVSSVEQDREKTVYKLEHSLRDPVVMTLEQDGDTSFFETLTPVALGTEQAYGRSEDGYQLLAFEKQGILYVLTCAYDINTLADLGRSILA